MARANRHYIPGNVWHITHRCHKKEFLLKFGRDRRCWIEWLFEARKYDGLVRPREKEKKGKKTILVPGEEKARAFHEEEKRLQKFLGVTNLNRNEGIDHSQQLQRRLMAIWLIVNSQQSTVHRPQLKNRQQHSGDIPQSNE